jgi:deazaflavin-dependent oxidoreductase (nitroreductase family)
MDLQQFLADISLKTMNRVHRAVVHLSGGHVLGSALGMPVVELHTVGRKSGRPRSTMLTAPVIDGDRVVLVASKGGDDRDPDWYLNLLAHPEVELTMGGRCRPVRARRASPQEKEELWPRVAAYQGYASYQRRTDRDIPLVICEPHLAIGSGRCPHFRPS